MGVKIIYTSLFIFTLSMSAYSQTSIIDWNRYRVEPILEETIKELREKGIEFNFNAANIDTVGPFLVAAVPVEAETQNLDESGSLALLVTFLPVPPPKDLVIVEVAQVIYRKSQSEDDVEIATRTAYLSSDGFQFGKVEPLLNLGPEGSINEIDGPRVIQSKMEYYSRECKELATQAGREHCRYLTENSSKIESMFCALTRWIWVKKTCAIFR